MSASHRVRHLQETFDCADDLLHSRWVLRDHMAAFVHNHHCRALLAVLGKSRLGALEPQLVVLTSDVQRRDLNLAQVQRASIHIRTVQMRSTEQNCEPEQIIQRRVGVLFCVVDHERDGHDRSLRKPDNPVKGAVLLDNALDVFERAKDLAYVEGDGGWIPVEESVASLIVERGYGFIRRALEWRVDEMKSKPVLLLQGARYGSAEVKHVRQGQKTGRKKKQLRAMREPLLGLRHARSWSLKIYTRCS